MCNIYQQNFESEIKGGYPQDKKNNWTYLNTSKGVIIWKIKNLGRRLQFATYLSALFPYDPTLAQIHKIHSSKTAGVFI